MGTTAEKLAYLDATKTAIKNAIVSKGTDVPEGTTFRQYADLISGISTGLSDEDLAKATATPGDVTVGKTFYAGDRTLKTGTSQGGGVLKNVTFTLNLGLAKMGWAYMYWTVQDGESTVFYKTDNPSGFSKSLVQYGVPIIVYVNNQGTPLAVSSERSKTYRLMAPGGVSVYAIFPEDGDSALITTL